MAQNLHRSNTQPDFYCLWNTDISLAKLLHRHPNLRSRTSGFVFKAFIGHTRLEGGGLGASQCLRNSWSKNHRPKLYKPLVLCNNHLEAFSKGSVLRMLRYGVPFPENTRLSKISQSCQLQLLFLKLQTICIWNEHSVDSYLLLYHAKTCQSTESQM